MAEQFWRHVKCGPTCDLQLLVISSLNAEPKINYLWLIVFVCDDDIFHLEISMADILSMHNHQSLGKPLANIIGFLLFDGLVFTLSLNHFLKTLTLNKLLNKYRLTFCLKCRVQSREKITLELLHTLNFRLNGFDLNSFEVVVNF